MSIKIRGAKTHNLKSINVDIPRDKLTVITGMSGCGKSSLAFDTLYAEGQRRYVESLSAYARQFLALMEKPDVDSIEGLSPAIAIQQKTSSHNPRSTVGTVTEIYDYLRLLFARIGDPFCPTHNMPLHAQTISQMVDYILELPEDAKMMILAPLVKDRKGEHQVLFEQLRAKGYVRVRIDRQIYELDDLPKLDAKKKHSIDVVVDRCKVKAEHGQRFSESLESAIGLGEGIAIVASLDEQFSEHLFSSKYACPHCDYSLTELSPRLFSFNNPMGACEACDGLGVHEFFDEKKLIYHQDWSIAQGAIGGFGKGSGYYYNLLEGLSGIYHFSINTPFSALPKDIQNFILHGEKSLKSHRNTGFVGMLAHLQRRYRQLEPGRYRDEFRQYISERPCDSCGGSRLKLAARHVKVFEQSLSQLCQYTIDDLHAFFSTLRLTGAKQNIAEKINVEIIARLGFLIDVGLDYLTLNRAAETLSGGEAQRIRLASQIGSGLVGVMYVLDEPSIGLHQRDNQRLLDTLFRLRDLGNTVIVVEHDEDAIRHADYVIDMGPKAGIHGGEIVAEGQPSDIMQNPLSLTGKYLSGALKIEVPTKRLPVQADKMLRLRGIHCNNLKQFDIDIPLGMMVCITGVSGSGKSSLINDTLYPIAATYLNGSRNHDVKVDSFKGFEHLDKVIDIDQSPIGRTPRSNPATYSGLLTPIRELFAGTPEARARGYQPGRFSFNVKGGRCEACQGDGMMRVEMHFLPDIFVPCDICQAKRYNRETLTVTYKGKNIDEVLKMTVEDASVFFAAIPSIAKKCQTLEAVGLGYITLGQSAVTLSGGEAQRIKLAKELSKRSTGKTLYILDEPTTGLHFYDVQHLLDVLVRLKEQGNSILVIEHHLDVIKTADWIIDMGPEGGVRGGQIVAQGTPEQVSLVKKSFTGAFLKPLLK